MLSQLLSLVLLAKDCNCNRSIIKYALNWFDCKLKASKEKTAACLAARKFHRTKRATTKHSFAYKYWVNFTFSENYCHPISQFLSMNVVKSSVSLATGRRFASRLGRHDIRPSLWTRFVPDRIVKC